MDCTCNTASMFHCVDGLALKVHASEALSATIGPYVFIACRWLLPPVTNSTESANVDYQPEASPPDAAAGRCS